jgi:hypothetical protein
MPTNRFSFAIFIMAVLALPNPTARAQEKVVHNSIYDFQGTSDGQGVAGSVVFDQKRKSLWRDNRWRRSNLPLQRVWHGLPTNFLQRAVERKRALCLSGLTQR